MSDKPHSQKVRGTLDHPIVKANIASGTAPKWGEDPTSTESEAHNIQDASQTANPGTKTSSGSQTKRPGGKSLPEDRHQDTLTFARTAGITGGGGQRAAGALGDRIKHTDDKEAAKKMIRETAPAPTEGDVGKRSKL